MEAVAEIIGGICGLKTVVRATCTDGMTVLLDVSSDCQRISAMAGEMTSLDAVEEALRKPLNETVPVLLAAKHKLHSSCLVPAGMLKAVEVAAGLALPCLCQVELSRSG
jgi:Family of unknown function (DUF6951)